MLHLVRTGNFRSWRSVRVVDQGESDCMYGKTKKKNKKNSSRRSKQQKMQGNHSPTSLPPPEIKWSVRYLRWMVLVLPFMSNFLCNAPGQVSSGVVYAIFRTPQWFNGTHALPQLPQQSIQVQGFNIWLPYFHLQFYFAFSSLLCINSSCPVLLQLTLFCENSSVQLLNQYSFQFIVTAEHNDYRPIFSVSLDLVFNTHKYWRGTCKQYRAANS